MDSGEIPIELGDSWFSSKTDAGPKKVTNSYQTKNAVKIPSGVSLREISRVDKRERAQTDS